MVGLDHDAIERQASEDGQQVVAFTRLGRRAHAVADADEDVEHRIDQKAAEQDDAGVWGLVAAGVLCTFCAETAASA